MVDEGSERERENENGGLSSMNSVESRWVFQDEHKSEIENDEDLPPRMGMEGMDSDDDEDNSEQRLIRTGPQIDSFDVEAFEVPSAKRNDFEAC